jgi:hypothetical protein
MNVDLPDSPEPNSRIFTSNVGELQSREEEAGRSLSGRGAKAFGRNQGNFKGLHVETRKSKLVNEKNVILPQ